MHHGLKDQLLKDICTIFSAHKEIEEAVLYGSRAKGNYKTGSDIDLSLKGNLSLKILNEIVLALDDLNSPYTFDISIYNQVNNEELTDHIDRVGQSIYKAIPDKEG